MSQKRVLVFTGGNTETASSKYRALLLGRYLTEAHAEIEWNIVTPSSKEISESPLLAQFRHTLVQTKLLFFPKHEVVYIQRAIYNKFLFAALLLHNILRIRPVIFDLDDAVYLHSAFKTKWMCKTATVVTVGSHHLEEYAMQHAKRAAFIPTCIKWSDYVRIERSTTETVTIGWIGNAPSYIPELRFIAEVLQELSEHTQQFRFLLIGAQSHAHLEHLYDFLGDRYEVIQYVHAKTDADLVPYLAKIDIGLMPLADTEWNRGKCSFKAIQYMAAGSAAVISPVGENTRLVEHQKTGMLANTKEEWVAALKTLIENPELRSELGKYAREYIEAHYSYESHIPHFAAIIDQLSRED